MSSNWASRHNRLSPPLGRRGIGTVTSAIAVAIVLVLVGVLTYGLLGGFSNQGTTLTCQPETSFICGQFVNLHDVKLLIPFKSVQQGAAVPFTVSLPPAETPTSLKLDFGDGTSSTSSATTISHNYSNPGTYLVQAQATVNGLVHDNVAALTLITVTSAYSATSAGNLPSITGSITGNSTAPAGARGVTAVLEPTQSVTVSGSYSSAPTNPAFFPNPPNISAPGGSFPNAPTLTPSSAGATVSYTIPGTYQITFIGSASDGNTTLYQNYTWTVVVVPSGTHAGVSGSQTLVSPHPGTIILYELAPGGAQSEDPAIDYETVGAEPIYNVYQTLISYNGTDSGPTWNDFIPNLATCVPGSPQCAALYSGDTLVDASATNYTFVIQRNASFFDPTTGAHWGVWPSDVLYSIARTMGFSTLPCVSCNNGWILAQALLNPGNISWDSIHATYNNTPQNILSSITLNGSDCPAAAMSEDHGCVTFHADGDHHIWPYFLELIADGQGGSVVSCGWFSAAAQAAGIPYWTSGNSTGAGDHPCGEPGAAGWGRLPTGSNPIPYTGWDQWEQLGSGAFGTYLGHVQFGMVGSGPYAIQQYSVGSSYTLEANPAYGQNPYCTWKGCQPAPGDYASTVDVTWETQATPGEQAYASGTADAASIPEPDLALLLQLIDAGKVNAVSAPTLTIGFYPFNLDFNIGAAQHFTTNPITVKSDFFSYLGMRQFFARAYPYQTIQNTISTRDGIQFSFGYGGAIPQFMANYYPKGIPWPSTDPCTDPTNTACPAYWWTQMNEQSSPFYDPEVAQCTANNACQLPMFGETGAAANDEVMSLWANSISSLTNGAIKVSPVDINFVDIIGNSEGTGPGANPMPIFTLGWAPDYPDPTDYVAPLYAANGTYTYGDSVSETLLTPSFTSGCAANQTDYAYFSNPANVWGNNCQGQAYKAMLDALGLAATTPPGTARQALYDQGEYIAYDLGLYTYTSQSNLVPSWSAWVDISSVNTNVCVGGGGITPFYWITGNGVQFRGST